MNNKKLTLVLLSTILSASIIGASFVDIKEASASVGNYTTSAATYYNGITATGGNELLGQLHDLMINTHKTYTTYNDCKTAEYVYQTDPGTTSAYVTDFYTQQDIAKEWGLGAVGTWNREHVWCESHSPAVGDTLLWERGNEKYGASDLHHLRPIETTLNSSRNNSPYGNLSDFGVNRENNKKYAKNTSSQNSQLGGYKTGDIFEPLDGAKGDVARVLMYVLMHYSTYSLIGGTTDGNISQYTGAFKINDIVATPAGTEDAAWELLLNWNANDPVSTAEQTRNEAAAKFQGNRNPFIDHPEYASKIWGNVTYDDLESLSINQTSVVLDKGGAVSLAVTPYPSTASGSVTWTTSNSDVATISSSGTVNAVGVGDAIITATSNVNNEISVSCSIKVNKQVSFAIVFNENDNDSTIALSTSTFLGENNVASNTLIKTVAETDKCYTGTSGMKMGTSSAIGTFTAIPVDDAQEKVTSITIKSETYNNDTGKLILKNGNTELVNNITPGENYTYEFANPTDIASFTIATTSKRAYLYEVIFNVYSESIALNKSSLELNYQESETLTADKSEGLGDITWTSSNPWVATVDNNGLVTAVGGGTATITATAGTVSDTCEVLVNEEFNAIGDFAQVTKVTGTSGLVAGGEYVILSEKNSVIHAMSKYVSGNNIKSNVVTIDDNSILNGTFEIYTLGGTIGAWTLQDSDNKYIYAAGGNSNKNYLKSQNGATGAEWKISFDNGDAVITCTNGANRNVIRKNDGDDLFSCYASGQTAVQLYKVSRVSFDDTEDNNSLALTFSHKLLTLIGNDVCSVNGNTVYSDLQTAWTGLMSQYNSLSDDGKNMLRYATADENGDTIQKAVSLYDYIVLKYEFDDTLKRNPTSGNSNITNLVIDNNVQSMPTIIILSTIILSIAFAIIIERKRSKID